MTLYIFQNRLLFASPKSSGIGECNKFLTSYNGPAKLCHAVPQEDSVGQNERVLPTYQLIPGNAR